MPARANPLRYCSPKCWKLVPLPPVAIVTVPGGDGTKYSKASQLIAATATKTAAIWITPARINLDILSADLENISVQIGLRGDPTARILFPRIDRGQGCRLTRA